MVDDAVVKVLSSEVGVSGGGEDLKDSVVNREERDIEGSSSEIVDDDVALSAGLIESVGDGGGGRLVDDAEDVESSDRSGILGGLALSVVEAARLASSACTPPTSHENCSLLGGNGDNGVSDLLSEVGLGGLLHLSEHHGGDLLGGERAANIADLDLDDGLTRRGGLDLERVVLEVLLEVLVVESPTDETLDVEDGVGRVLGSLVLGGVSDEALSGRRSEADVGGGDTVALVLGTKLSSQLPGSPARSSKLNARW